MTVSFTHPHDPYVARRRFWDLYADCPALDPEVGPIPFAAHSPHSQRLLKASDADKFDISTEDVRRSRRAYFANLSYIDEKLGELLAILQSGRLAQNTVVLFVSDHGDMLGEQGLWFKMSFREGSSRVPLMMAEPGGAGQLVEAPVSTLDVLPTLAALAGVNPSSIAPFADGHDLLATAKAGQRAAPVPVEYAAEGSQAPMVSLREGPFKLNLCPIDPPELYDLAADPRETANLLAADRPLVPDAQAAFERLSALAARALGSCGLRRGCARKPAAPARHLRRAAQRRLFSVGSPAAAEGLGALHAQPHGFERSGRAAAVSTRRMMR